MTQVKCWYLTRRVHLRPRQPFSRDIRDHTQQDGWKTQDSMSRKIVNSQSWATVFRHSAVLSLPAFLLDEVFITPKKGVYSPLHDNLSSGLLEPEGLPRPKTSRRKDCNPQISFPSIKLNSKPILGLQNRSNANTINRKCKLWLHETCFIKIKPTSNYVPPAWLAVANLSEFSHRNSGDDSKHNELSQIPARLSSRCRGMPQIVLPIKWQCFSTDH